MNLPNHAGVNIDELTIAQAEHLRTALEAKERAEDLMTKRKSPYPKCIYCKKRKATRWDGGQCGTVLESIDKGNGVKQARMRPGYIVWVCTKCDKGHNHFDLPDTLDDAIAEIVALRERVQEEFVKSFDKR